MEIVEQKMNLKLELLINLIKTLIQLFVILVMDGLIMVLDNFVTGQTLQEFNMEKDLENKEY